MKRSTNSQTSIIHVGMHTRAHTHAHRNTHAPTQKCTRTHTRNGDSEEVGDGERKKRGGENDMGLDFTCMLQKTQWEQVCWLLSVCTFHCQWSIQTCHNTTDYGYSERPGEWGGGGQSRGCKRWRGKGMKTRQKKREREGCGRRDGGEMTQTNWWTACWSQQCLLQLTCYSNVTVMRRKYNRTWCNIVT